MEKCLELAKKGQGKTSPNPLVGCIILNEKEEIISEGFHEKYGEFHAERNALNNIENVEGGTLVVNLEPCCHHGKTPPCTDIIIEKGIKKVIYGMQDPNPIIGGKGLQVLKDAGIEVIGPVLENKCKNLNEIFIKNQTKKQTFVAIKTATTIDGKISTENGNSKWITSEKSRSEVRNIRQKYDAILTSSSTVIADNPTMEHRNKIILDRNLNTDINSNIYKNGLIYVFHDENLDIENNNENIRYIKTPVSNNKLEIEFILNKLFEYGIMSVLVEAGGMLNESMLPFADKLYHFIAPKILGDNNGKSCFYGDKKNLISECTSLEFSEIQTFDTDILLIYNK